MGLDPVLNVGFDMTDWGEIYTCIKYFQAYIF